LDPYIKSKNTVLSNPVNYTDLFNRMLERKCSRSEAEELVRWLSAEPQHSEAARLINAELQKVLNPDAVNDERVHAVIEECLNRILKEKQPSIHRVHFLKTSWFRYAASVIVIISAAALVRAFMRQRPSAPVASVLVSHQDISPGTNRAILTVGNQSINLSNNKTGIAVGKAITYTDGERIADAGQLLQLSTPRGGQYQAVLPDGTKVWLNAASSIKFPSKFTGATREVEVTGEAYLEVAKNTKQPFFVHTNKETIQVLGTSFNVNAYEDEEAEKTTLINGSIVVSSFRRSDEGATEKSPNTQRFLANARNDGAGVILKPNQQSIIKENKIQIQTINSDEAIAWKNGIFNFNKLPLREVLRQLARWYDVEVVYQKGVPDIMFVGEMERDLTLNQVLNVLSKMEVHFKLEGRKLIVME
jgi:transmembrane sensor